MPSTTTAHREPDNGISVLIAGAGIGGLFTALECWRQGCNVRIIERAPSSSAQGDNFGLGPSALAALRNWPFMAQRNEEIGDTPLMSYHNHRGERLSEPVAITELLAPHPTGAKLAFHSRPKFHEMLLEQLEACGVEVEYGKKAVEYFEDEGTGSAGIVLREGGERVEADVVVAADGAHTMSYKLMKGADVKAKSSGHAILRAAFPVELAMEDEMIRERFPLEGRSMAELWIGPDVYLTFSRNHERFGWTITHPDEGTADETWSSKVHPDDALKFTSTIPDFPEVANRVIKVTPPERLIDWRLMWRDPNSNWTSPAGRVIQLGDAAHSFLPSSGNGGTQALEDAISFAKCLALCGGKQNIPSATRVHNLLRFERVSCLQAFGIANREARNTNKVDANDKKHEVRMGSWIVAHDPEAYAGEKWAEALECVKENRQKDFKNTNIPKGMEYVPWTIDSLMEAREKGEKTVLDGDWS